MIVIVVGYVESVEKPETSDSEAIFEDLAFRKTSWKEKSQMWKTRPFNLRCGKSVLIVEKSVENVESLKLLSEPGISVLKTRKSRACFAYSCINMQNAGRFIVNLQNASGTDVLHDVVHGLLQVAVLADVLLHRIDGVHNGGMVTLEFGTDGFHAHTGDLADDIH